MRDSKKGKFILLNALLIFLLILAFYFDNQIASSVSLIKNSFLDYFFTIVTFVSSIFIIFIFLTLLFIKENKRKWLVPLWATLVLDVIISFVLKISIQRARPFELGFNTILPALDKAAYASWDFSFPSFQTMMVFSAIPFLSKEFPKVKYFWIVFACIVAFSRIYLGLHFLSDVIAGALIGYLIGYFAVRRIEKR